MKKIISVFICTLMLLGAFTLAAFADDGRLKFNNGKFTILHIADTQDDMYPAFELAGFIEKAIDLVQPDLVVFGGDTVEDSRIGDPCVDAQGYREGVKTDDDYAVILENSKIACDAVFSIINDKGIPFAVTQGNNDYKCIENKDWLDIYASYEHCLVHDDSSDNQGRIDYNLPIYSENGESILFNIYMLDNGNGTNATEEQLVWYKQTSDALIQQAGSPVPSFVFQHRPISETGYLFEECKPWDSGAIAVGLKWYKLGENATGHGEIYQAPGESTQFAAWKQQGDVIGAYFGHEHTDGYTGVYDGIELGLTYGAEFAKAGPYGIRVLTVDESNVKAYTNELYTYNNGKFTLQEGDNAQLSFIIRIFAFFRRLFASL